MDHCFAQLFQLPRVNKADVDALEMVEPAFRQNFDEVSPDGLMNTSVGLTQHVEGEARERPEAWLIKPSISNFAFFVNGAARQ